MNTDIKQRIAEWKAFTHPFADPLILKNLLTDCLKHIEDLTTNPNYEGGVQYWIGRHNRMASLATKLEAQLREREADCAAKRIALIHSYSWIGCDECGTDLCDTCLGQKLTVDKALSTTAGCELLERLQAVEAERDRYREAFQPVIDWMRSINTPDVSEFLGQLTALEMRKQLANLEALQAQKEQ